MKAILVFGLQVLTHDRGNKIHYKVFELFNDCYTISKSRKFELTFQSQILREEREDNERREREDNERRERRQ